MSVFHALYNAPVEIYAKDLEDEVMSLRAQLQITRNQLGAVSQAFDTHDKTLVGYMQGNEILTKDRDFWQREAEMWKKAHDDLIAKIRGI
jgi:hypothetical protein